MNLINLLWTSEENWSWNEHHLIYDPLNVGIFIVRILTSHTFTVSFSVTVVSVCLFGETVCTPNSRSFTIIAHFASVFFLTLEVDISLWVFMFSQSFCRMCSLFFGGFCWKSSSNRLVNWFWFLRSLVWRSLGVFLKFASARSSCCFNNICSFINPSSSNEILIFPATLRTWVVLSLVSLYLVENELKISWIYVKVNHHSPRAESAITSGTNTV